MRAAAQGLAHQMAHSMLDDMLSQTFGRPRPQRSHSLISLQMSYKPGSPPPIRELPEVVEREIRRIIGARPATTTTPFFGLVFCPVCGPRPATETVVEAIESARGHSPSRIRLRSRSAEQLRASGVFERFAVDALGSVVSLFELFAREQFAQRVGDADAATRRKGRRLPATR